ncbi:MAG: YHS domain-containing protein [Fimbriimonadia bacterium]|jgi:YHS domain-containing protein
MPPICPVTGHRIEDVKAAPNSVYEGKRYYFQCPSCKAEFDRDPIKYTAGFDEKIAAAKKASDSSEESDESDKSDTSH